MTYFAGIDVSLEESSICVVDAGGKIIREVKVASEPEALVRKAMFSSCNVVRLKANSRTKSTRIMTIICMSQTVAGSGLQCQEFRGRRGFEERQVSA